MIRYLLFILFLLFCVSCLAQTEDEKSNVLIFDHSTMKFRERKSPLPFGEKIIITGKLIYDIDEISVSAFYNEKKVDAEITLQGTNWTALVGPFPKKANVTFMVTEKRKVNDEDIHRLNDILTESSMDAYQELLWGKKSFYPHEFGNEYVQILERMIRQDMSAYFISGKSLNSIIIDTLRKIFSDPDNLKNLSALNKIQSIRSDTFYKIIKNDSILQDKFNIDTSGIELIKFIAEVDSNKRKFIIDTLTSQPGIVREGVKTLFDSLCVKSKNFIKAKESIDSILLLKSNLIFKESLIAQSITTSQELLGIESYMGIDIGFTYIKDMSATPIFLTISPYLLKIDPEKDYTLDLSHVCDSVSVWKTLLYFFTPTVGFCMGGDNKKIDPIYFIGIGCRINKIVRIAYGRVYYTKSEDNRYTWSYGLNASLNVNFISDFFKLITTAQSSIN